jgi:hypothetical protein
VHPERRKKAFSYTTDALIAFFVHHEGTETSLEDKCELEDINHCKNEKVFSRLGSLQLC